MSFLFLFGWLLMGVSHFTYHGGAWSAVSFRTLLLLGRLLTGVSAGWAAGVVPGRCNVLSSCRTVGACMLRSTPIHELLQACVMS